MEFVHNLVTTGRRIGALTAVDTFSRCAPVLDPRFSYPKLIRFDRGLGVQLPRHGPLGLPEWRSLYFSPPGKATANAFIEAFNAPFPAECLITHSFPTLADAVEKSEAWRRDYNGQRPYGSIENKVPAALMRLRTQPARAAAGSRETLALPGERWGAVHELKDIPNDSEGARIRILLLKSGHGQSHLNSLA